MEAKKINMNYKMIMTLMRSEIDKFHKCLLQNDELSSWKLSIKEFA